MSALCDDWKKAKQQAEKLLTKGLFRGEDLGAWLKKKEAVENKIEDLSGVEVKALDKARAELKKILYTTSKGLANYAKIADQFQKDLKGTKEVAVIDDVLEVIKDIRVALVDSRDRYGIKF